MQASSSLGHIIDFDHMGNNSQKSAIPFRGLSSFRRRPNWYGVPGIVSGYLSGEGFERYHFSGGWVFPYWWEFGRFYKKEKGIYVPDDELVRLSLITFEERRETNVWFDIFVDVRKYGWDGMYKAQNENWSCGINCAGIALFGGQALLISQDY